MNKKAIFHTKIVAPGEDYTKYNGQTVEIINSTVYNSGFRDVRYTIKFQDGKIVSNILVEELKFI